MDASFHTNFLHQTPQTILNPKSIEEKSVSEKEAFAQFLKTSWGNVPLSEDYRKFGKTYLVKQAILNGDLPNNNLTSKNIVIEDSTQLLSIPLVFQKLGFCQNQRLRFNPLEAVSYPRDRSDAEGIKDRDADEGKNQLLKHEGYMIKTPKYPD